jgi:hypothetical protein
MTKGGFLYSEARLAEHLGMPRRQLSEARIAALEKNADWQLVEGQVALSLHGILNLLRNLGVAAGRVNPTACFLQGKNGVRPSTLLLMDPGRTPDPVLMRVRRLFPNPRLIECVEVNRPGQIQHVLVRNNSNFTIGMTFKAIPDPANPAYWILAGPLPRYRGRW